ncbi:MAG: phosphate ABC transporter substrate-binding protein [Ignavibacteriales bacterium]
MRSLGKAMLTAVLVLALGGLAACTKHAEPAGPSGPPGQPGPQTTITIAGSTSVQPVSERLSEAFMAKNRGVRINVQGGGSSAGIKAARSGVADIGSSSRDLTSEERGLNEIPIAGDGIAIIVNPGSPLENLTLEQIKSIFAGDVTDWKGLGQPASPITVVVREDGSGTRAAFEELVMKGTKCTANSAIQNSTGAVRATVATNPNAIGYVSLAGLDSTVKAVRVEGVEPTAANILNGTYRVNRPFLYLTREAPTGLVKEYIDFVLSPEGQDIVAGENLVRVR